MEHSNQSKDKWNHEEIISSFILRQCRRKFFEPHRWSHPVCILIVAFSSGKIEKEVTHIHMTDLVLEHVDDVIAESGPVIFTHAENASVSPLVIRVCAPDTRQNSFVFRIVLVRDSSISNLVFVFSLDVDLFTLFVIDNLRCEILTVQ